MPAVINPPAAAKSNRCCALDRRPRRGAGAAAHSPIGRVSYRHVEKQPGVLGAGFLAQSSLGLSTSTVHVAGVHFSFLHCLTLMDEWAPECRMVQDTDETNSATDHLRLGGRQQVVCMLRNLAKEREWPLGRCLGLCEDASRQDGHWKVGHFTLFHRCLQAYDPLFPWCLGRSRLVPFRHERTPALTRRLCDPVDFHFLLVHPTLGSILLPLWAVHPRTSL